MVRGSNSRADILIDHSNCLKRQPGLGVASHVCSTSNQVEWKKVSAQGGFVSLDLTISSFLLVQKLHRNQLGSRMEESSILFADLHYPNIDSLLYPQASKTDHMRS